jgi:streptogramin lyase
MLPCKSLLLASVGLAAVFLQTEIGAQAQNAPPLSGQVTSAAEPVMEGVLVSAKKEGSNITTTVVTNEQGKFSFPAGRLEPGHYTLAIRASGYDLEGPKAIDIPAEGGATAEIKLGKAKNLVNQLSNAEWMNSMPGSDSDKRFLGDCVGCHTLQRIVTSTHDAEEFLQIFKRMGTYSPGSTPLHPQPLLPGPRGERPAVSAARAPAAAAYLASIDMSTTETRAWPLKTLPRPKGKSTRVIITEYDLPRKEAQPHDVIVAADGTVWYSDFGAQFAGYMDPKTGKATDIPIPVLKPEQPKGSLDIELDPKGNIWLSLMYQAGIAKIDPKTKEVTTYPFPKEWQTPSTQASMVSPGSSDVDGKVWTNNQEMHASYRLDVATGQYENFGESKDAKGKQVSGYGMPVDKENNLYLLEFGGTSIGRVNAKTKEVNIYATPFVNSRPRRGRVNHENVLWFAEYGADAIGMFDPKTEKITEFKLPSKFSAPYDVVPAKDGTVWTGSMMTDQVSRLDPKTAEVVDYLMPRPTNMRRVFVDENAPKPTLWVGSNHGASIIKVEPLD